MIDMIRRHPLMSGIVAFLALIVLLSSFPIVPETEQAVVVRFGRPERVSSIVPAGQADRLGGRRPLVSHSICRPARLDG